MNELGSPVPMCTPAPAEALIVEEESHNYTNVASVKSQQL